MFLKGNGQFRCTQLTNELCYNFIQTWHLVEYNCSRMQYKKLLQGTQLSQVIKLKTEECNVCNYFKRHDIEFAPTRKSVITRLLDIN